MFAKFSTRSRSRKLRRRVSYRPIAEQLEGRRLLAANISFVDANNDGLFMAMPTDGDVMLTTEVLDGVFDTRRAEGAYTTPIPNAGLYIGVDPTTLPSGIVVTGDIKFKADGLLIVNTNLTAGDDIKLLSRNDSVELDDPTLTAADDIEIEAALDIVSTDDILTAGSEIELEAGRDILLFGTSVTAMREVELEAGGSIQVGDSQAGQGSITASHTSKGEVELKAELDIDVSGADIDAGKEIELKSKGGVINVDNAMIGVNVTPREVELKASGDILADGTIIDASREIELKSKGGSIDAPNALIGNGTQMPREIEMKASVDINVDGARLIASRDIELKAGGSIFAIDAFMEALGSRKADIELKANGDIILFDATVTNPTGTTLNAMDEVELKSKRGSIDATGSMVTAGDEIELKAELDITVTGWIIPVGQDVELKAGGMITGP